MTKQLTIRITLLSAGLCLFGPNGTAANYSVLHRFGAVTNVTGFSPQAPLIQGPDGTLYGTTSTGGAGTNGTIFSIQPDGTGFTTLHSFSAFVPGSYTNSDGANPQAGLILSGNTLYGTAPSGGNSSGGTVFSLSTDGTGFQVLHDFTGSDGAGRGTRLALSAGVLYGTTAAGGSAAVGGYGGTIFSVNTDGTGFTTLYSFSGPDGSNPAGDLLLVGTVLYGTTSEGGAGLGNPGTVFSVNTDGTGFTTLHYFDLGSAGEGGQPYGNLVLSNNVLYGTAFRGGTADYGVVFRLSTDGTGFSLLHSFTYPSFTLPQINGDGAYPQAGLVLFSNTLYGTTTWGGSAGVGTVFEVNLDGTGFRNLHNFTGGTLGGGASGLILSGSTLYGTTLELGSEDAGTVFKLNVAGSAFTNLYSFAWGGSDGGGRKAGLTLSGNMLYGITSEGGTRGLGTIFKLSSDGSVFKTIRNLNGYETGSSSSGVILQLPALSGSTLYLVAPAGGLEVDGTGDLFKVNADGTGFAYLCDFGSAGWYGPGGPICSGNVLYGTARGRNTGAPGAVFRININGTGLTTIHEFTGTSDGGAPDDSLVLSSNILYGTTSSGGAAGAGTVFKVNINAAGFTTLHSFDALVSGTNNDGAQKAGLVLSGSTLYGTATRGGSAGMGTVFRVNTDGTAFQVLHEFNGPEGSWPSAPLAPMGASLYGITSAGGIGFYGPAYSGNGTVFQVNTDGTGFTNLYFFGGNDGANPEGDVALSGNTLYGTTDAGGPAGAGIVFALQLPGVPIPLSIQSIHDGAVLTWSDPSFLLQAGSTVTGPYTNIPGAITPYTNAVDGAQRFFRLTAQ